MKRLLRAQLTQAFGIRFFLIVVGIVMVYGATVIGYYHLETESMSALDLLFAMDKDNGIETLVLILCSGLPYAFSFYEENRSKAQLFWLQRTGIIRYTVSKVLVTAFSAMLSVMLAELVFLGFCCIRHPFWIPLRDEAVEGYQNLLVSGRPLLFLFALISHRGLCAAMFAVIGLTASVFADSPYVPAAASLLASMLMIRTALAFHVDYSSCLNPGNWIGIPNISAGGSPLGLWLLRLAITAGFLMLSVVLFRIGLRRRCEKN